MTFDQAQGTFRTHKNYETACTYLVIAAQRKANDAIGKDMFFDAVGEVANWLAASDTHLLRFEAAKATADAWGRHRNKVESMRRRPRAKPTFRPGPQ
jgi:hypothetical protein